ncbi:MAG TPA: hypothetical protein VI980_01245 [Acidimicrobiia bacterium]|nr:hypothetical protein [Acidimicrobiia bacterium]
MIPVLLVLVGLALLTAGTWAIYTLLTRVSAQGGAIDGDATEIANQILAEQDAFLGRSSDESPAWDGKHRLQRPTFGTGSVD